MFELILLTPPPPLSLYYSLLRAASRRLRTPAINDGLILVHRCLPITGLWTISDLFPYVFRPSLRHLLFLTLLLY